MDFLIESRPQSEKRLASERMALCLHLHAHDTATLAWRQRRPVRGSARIIPVRADRLECIKIQLLRGPRASRAARATLGRRGVVLRVLVDRVVLMPQLQQCEPMRRPVLGPDAQVWCVSIGYVLAVRVPTGSACMATRQGRSREPLSRTSALRAAKEPI